MKSTMVAFGLVSLMMVAANVASAQDLDHYLCYRATGPITIDGKLDEPSWGKAPWSGPFVHLVTGEPIPPMLETRAALVWDDSCLYVAITEKEEDVKAYMTERDEKIYADYIDAEVFITASDTSDTYYEFEVNALNTIYEVFWVFEHARVPGTIWHDDPQWDPQTQSVIGGGSSGRWGFLDWDFPGILTAVHVDGTLNESDDTDNRWTMEAAFPWQGMALLADGRALPPQAGDVWRVDCSRFGWGRVPPEVEAQFPRERGWCWNRHGYWDSHMPEKFTYLHLTMDAADVAPQVLSAAITPAVLPMGQSALLDVAVTLNALPEATPCLGGILLDLSAAGGPSEVPLEHCGDGRFHARETVTLTRNGEYSVPVHMTSTYEWDTGATRYRLATLKLSVYPRGDLVVYDDEPGDGWTVEVTRGESDPASSAFAHTGGLSHAIGPGACMVEYACQDPEGIGLFGYTHLEFWINGGGASGQNPQIAGVKLSNLGIVPEADTWTKVSIPVSRLADPLTSFYIGGWVNETFYLDDMKLVAGEPPTAVEDMAEAAAVPVGYVLSENYPNPFNVRTVIRYALAEAGTARLCVYDVHGQIVRTLVDGQRSAGTDSATWDGRDATGREVASGVYLYRLEVEGQRVQTRRMVLLR